jgi:DNA-binding winged helix-turn-helix (wHTH) protein
MQFMLKGRGYYEFAGVRFLPHKGVIKAGDTNREISLSQIQRNFLLALVERQGVVVTYEELRAQVWSHEPEMSPRVQHTMHVTKGHLVSLLKGSGVRAEFIESVPGIGYRLTSKVMPVDESEEAKEYAADDHRGEDARPSPVTQNDVGEFTHQEPSAILLPSHSHHPIFIMVGSLLYGLLFCIAMLLETAYQFDMYGAPAARMGSIIAVINMAAVALALVLARQRLRQKKGGGLIVGLSMLIAAVVASGWLASQCLPDEPVTLSRLQAQPAFAAFMKNAIVYFLPLGFFFLLVPFYFVAAEELRVRGVFTTVPGDAIFIRPNSLIIVCLVAVVYSLVTTFYLLDNLLPGTYHGLFVSLIFVRFVVYFSLGFGALLWYKLALNKTNVLR